MKKMKNGIFGLDLDRGYKEAGGGNPGKILPKYLDEKERWMGSECYGLLHAHISCLLLTKLRPHNIYTEKDESQTGNSLRCNPSQWYDCDNGHKRLRDVNPFYATGSK